MLFEYSGSQTACAVKFVSDVLQQKRKVGCMFGRFRSAEKQFSTAVVF